MCNIKMYILLMILTFSMRFNIFAVKSFPYRLFGFPRENKSAILAKQSVESYYNALSKSLQYHEKTGKGTKDGFD